MNAEQNLAFLTQLLELIGKLQDLIKDHCQLILAEEQGSHLVECDKEEDIPF